MATISMQDLTMARMVDHTIYLITEAAMKGKKARSPDEFGACSVLQGSLDHDKDIHLFLSSSKGLIMDQSSGYSYQMQRSLDLSSSHKLGGSKGSLFRRIGRLQLEDIHLRNRDWHGG